VRALASGRHRILSAAWKGLQMDPDLNAVGRRVEAQAGTRLPGRSAVIAGESRTLALIALWFAGIAVASGVWWNVPLIDDWTYAWSVERLLESGRFEVLDWTGNFVFGQVVWGAAWSWLPGFSFAALRLSTLVAGFVACAGLYLMLRDLERPRSVALAGALTLGANPAFVVLSASFMTDVPFAACTTLSLLCYGRAAKFARADYLWWAGVWAIAAFTVRQIGIIVPLAGAPLLLVRRQSRTFNRGMVAAALAVAWSAMGALWLIQAEFVGSTSVMGKWVERLQHLFLVKPASYLAYNLDLLSVLAFFLLPALLAATGPRTWRSRRLAAASMIALAALIAVFGELPLPIPPSETWSLREIGGSRSLVHGSMLREPDWMGPVARLAGFMAFTLLVTWVLKPVEWVRRAAAAVAALVRRRALAGDWSRAASPRACLIAFILGYIAIVNFFWLYNDRYYLALIPPAAALILAGVPEARVVPRPAWVAIGMFGIIALVGSRDAFRFNRAVGEARESLVSGGVAPSDIDAGYAWNGWALYAHPENLASGMKAESDVPWINSSRRARYVLSKTPLPDYDVVRVIEWRDLPWPGPDRLFVMRRREPESGDR
jgi:4-amino-4-deoxy-L-arabinose transferase-like glycosyltransferase